MNRLPRYAGRLVALALLMVFAAGSSAYALWSDAVIPDSGGPRTGVVGFGAGRDGAIRYATGAADSIEVPLNADDAAHIVNDSSGLAIAMQVRLLADGTAGMTYSIAVPSFRDGTVFASSTIEIFRVGAPTGCIPGASGSREPLTDVVGLGNTYGVAKSVTHYWCLTARFDPAKAGTYRNRATVSGTADNGVTIDGTGSWVASTTPDPRDEPTTHLVFTHTVTRPSGCNAPQTSRAPMYPSKGKGQEKWQTQRM